MQKTGLSTLILISFMVMAWGCKPSGDDKKSGPPDEQSRKNIQGKSFTLNIPKAGTYVQPAENLEVNFERIIEDAIVDSVKFMINGEMVKFSGSEEISTTLQIPDIPPGAVNLHAVVYTNGGNEENYYTRIKITSDKKPVTYGYRVVKSYAHDKGAYTQGLEYHDGYIYEGTGNYGESSLRKIDLETGDIIKYRNLPSDIFGEGITWINGKIFQITYRAQMGFVYDDKNFELIRKFYYQMKEGWGLTNNTEQILMSDGSNNIYFMDTTYFSLIRTIEVFDQEKEIDLLNELELINGIIYANRYTTDEIVMIDPETGKLLGRIDMSGLLKAEDRHPRIDYFNGIAYDPVKKRIFVTGKYWPKIYEVEFIRKGQ